MTNDDNLSVIVSFNSMFMEDVVILAKQQYLSSTNFVYFLLSLQFVLDQSIDRIL